MAGYSGAPQTCTTDGGKCPPQYQFRTDMAHYELVVVLLVVVAFLGLWVHARRLHEQLTKLLENG